MQLFEKYPQFGQPLTSDHLQFLETFTKGCRHSIVQMVVNAQSGHPGGSLSSIDFLATLYAFIVSQTGEKVVVSNGHTSPAVYSVLAEMGYIPKNEVVETFRKIGSIYEGHITRHVKGVHYGTGPLGIGVSVAAAYAMSEKLKGSNKKVYCELGDGEAQEGQVHEMIHFAKQHQLDNLVVIVDYNKVQLTASLKEIQDIDIHKTFEAGHWHVIEIDGHDYQSIWKAYSEAQNYTGKPVVIVANTIMGKRGGMMEPDGLEHKATWHGKSPKPKEIADYLQKETLTTEENEFLDQYRATIKWHPESNSYPALLSKIAEIKTGEPKLYEAGTVTDCRSAYGNALLDLAQDNSQILALTADLMGSVKTDGVHDNLPAQYVECGIAEQNMVSLAGGFSLDDFIPFASTFGAFMSSRAKDQARVNDINHTNVKMVATHCGLSVGEDGPTHQAIDDMGSFLGFFNTMVIEPADANQTDHIIRYVASHYGNFYVRMGRHKFPVILKEDGSIFYDQDYQYQYGRSDIIRSGNDLTIAASGALVNEAIKARESLQTSHPDLSIEIVAVSSIKQFDDTLINSIKKTGKLITAEDHNTYSGLGSQLSRSLMKKNICPEKFKMIGVEEYQLSGTADQLYQEAGLSGEHLAAACLKLIQ